MREAKNIKIYSGVMCCVSCVTCYISRVACHVSRVTCLTSLTPTATGTDPSPAISSSMHSRRVREDLKIANSETTSMSSLLFRESYCN